VDAEALGPEERFPVRESGRADDLRSLGGSDMARLLDRIPGAWERIEQGISDARLARTTPLDET
jgi:hypothetical protein